MKGLGGNWESGVKSPWMLTAVLGTPVTSACLTPSLLLWPSLSAWTEPTAASSGSAVHGTRPPHLLRPSAVPLLTCAGPVAAHFCLWLPKQGCPPDPHRPSVPGLLPSLLSPSHSSLPRPLASPLDGCFGEGAEGADPTTSPPPGLSSP